MRVPPPYLLRPTLRAAPLATLIALLLCAPAGIAGPELEWRQDLFSALSEGREAGRPAVIRFDADWCSICDRLERSTLRHEQVARRLAGFERVLVDVTRMTPARRELMDRFGVRGVPALLFVSRDGDILEQLRISGFVEPEQLLAVLDRVARTGRTDSISRISLPRR